jgi:hypothetical protein
MTPVPEGRLQSWIEQELLTDALMSGSLRPNRWGPDIGLATCEIARRGCGLYDRPFGPRGGTQALPLGRFWGMMSMGMRTVEVTSLPLYRAW